MNVPTSSLEFQLVEMVVDNWRHQGGDIQVRRSVEIRNHIREVLVGLKPGYLQYPLSIPVNWDMRSPHDSDSIRLTKRFVVLFGNNEGNDSALLTRQDEMNISAVVRHTPVSLNEFVFGAELCFDRRDKVNKFGAKRLPARARFHFVEGDGLLPALRKDCAVNMVNEADPEELLRACGQRWEYATVSGELDNSSPLQAAYTYDGQQQKSRSSHRPAHGVKVEKTST